jgi:hypothetical protein
MCAKDIYESIPNVGFAPGTPEFEYWIGLNDRANENYFTYTDGSEPNTNMCFNPPPNTWQKTICDKNAVNLYGDFS